VLNYFCTGSRDLLFWSLSTGGTRCLRAGRTTYRRLALETLGANNLISDHTILRAHDRANPMMIKMFTSSNYGKRDFKAMESKATCEDWDAPDRILEVQEALEKYTAVWFTMFTDPPTSSGECCCSRTWEARQERTRKAESGTNLSLQILARFRIRIQVRIRILLCSSLTFKMPGKNKVLTQFFLLVTFEGTLTLFFKEKFKRVTK
jgi:hypothetical protein